MSEMPELKRCTRCTELLPTSMFRPGGKGSRSRFRSQCIKCEGEVRAERRARKNDPAIWEGTKVCDVCTQEKPKTEFYFWGDTADGFSGPCKACYCKKRTDAYDKNPEPHTQSVKKWKENNPEKYKQVRDEHKKKFEARPENAPKRAAREAWRYALSQGRVELPPWCEICPKPSTSAHHFCYDKEYHLDVQALCDDCHYRANRLPGKFRFLTKDIDKHWEFFKKLWEDRSKKVGVTTAPSDQPGEI